jgi:hypothetical protein
MIPNPIERIFFRLALLISATALIGGGGRYVQLSTQMGDRQESMVKSLGWLQKYRVRCDESPGRLECKDPEVAQRYQDSFDSAVRERDEGLEARAEAGEIALLAPLGCFALFCALRWVLTGRRRPPWGLGAPP